MRGILCGCVSSLRCTSYKRVAQVRGLLRQCTLGMHGRPCGGVSGAGVDQVVLVGPDDGLDTVAQAQLAQDATNVCFHGSLG